ncbi:MULTISPECIES: helix-turn-helix domain-containing protein [Paenibacillus]|uniref:helix-turn-helix domain-containing protein n=1 Tax=Paenibacillus TaxID=44249 RepID=UPI0022B85DD7|nr:helix-turn-helix transcriptional regulator [Paenibacillus caseinilyticus]MCZ8521198.1 helix-turn-helix transcriptional regulator [Paenibacillus caseinilyticus]
MKMEIVSCLLRERLKESGMAAEELAARLLYKPEKLYDYMELKRVMPLQVAVSIAGTLGCDVRALYEWRPVYGYVEESGG